MTSPSAPTTVGTAANMNHRFGTIGIYVAPPGAGQSHYLDFYKACGYNYLEFCENGFAIRPDRIPQTHADMAAQITAAQKKGFKVWILLLAGMKQWKGPAPSGSAGTFGVLDTALLEERLARIQEAVRDLRVADGFEFFAGDPGGDPEGRATIRDCMRFAQRVQTIVRENAPKAGFAVNLWAIAEWGGFPSPFTLDFWQKQVALSRAAAEEPGVLGPRCGVVFSLDNYYRSLTLACYANSDATPELYPQADDIGRLRDRGARPIYGWPYFLVDECDDGFITPNNVVTKGQPGAETRYVRAIVDRGRELGLDGMIANAAYVAAEPLNIYAFARMCRAPKLTPEKLLNEYAGIVADGASRAALARVLRFIENHSNWQNSLPPRYRLPDIGPSDVPSAQAAMALLDSVTPRADPPIVLPEPPAAYLRRLQGRLEAIAAGNIGGPPPGFGKPATAPGTGK